MAPRCSSAPALAITNEALDALWTGLPGLRHPAHVASGDKLVGPVPITLATDSGDQGGIMPPA